MDGDTELELARRHVIVLENEQKLRQAKQDYAAGAIDRDTYKAICAEVTAARVEHRTLRASTTPAPGEVRPPTLTGTAGLHGDEQAGEA